MNYLLFLEICRQEEISESDIPYCDLAGLFIQE